MTPHVCRLAIWTLAIATAVGAVPSLSRAFHAGRSPTGTFRAADDRRALVERFVPPGADIEIVRNDPPDRPSPIARSIRLAIAWAAIPGVVHETWLPPTSDYVLVSPFDVVPFDTTGYDGLRQGYATLLIRRNAPLRGASAVPSSDSSGHEFVGLVLPAVLLALAAGWWCRQMPGRLSSGAVIAALFLCGVCTWLTLAHTFLGPGGTGVSGGRAKLIWVFRGFPPGFFVDPAYELYQAAYPPLQALIVFGGYLMAGGCGEWMTQLMVVWFSCVLFMLVIRDIRGGTASVALFLVFFLAHPVMASTTTFCSEPLMALLVLSGWFRVRDGHDDGWIILGCAGLVKNEGILYLPAIWLSVRLSGRELAHLSSFILGLLPAVVWHVGCRLLGASLHDFAPVWSPDPVRAGIACLRVLRECFLTPWRYAFAFPLAVALAISSVRHPSARFGRLVVPLAAIFLLLAFVFVYSLSRTPDFGWHLDSLPRLLWPVALLLLSESLAAFDCSAVARSDDSQRSPLTRIWGLAFRGPRV